MQFDPAIHSVSVSIEKCDESELIRRGIPFEGRGHFALLHYATTSAGSGVLAVDIQEFMKKSGDVMRELRGVNHGTLKEWREIESETAVRIVRQALTAENRPTSEQES